MQVARKFTRWKGSGNPASYATLGSDSAPSTTAPNASTDTVAIATPPTGTAFACVGVAYHGPTSTAPLVGTLYVWMDDPQSGGRWFQSGPSKSLATDVVTYFPIPAPYRMPSGQGGGVEVFVLVAAGGTTPTDGQHDFSVAFGTSAPDVEVSLTGSSIAVAGATTPADAFANPTTAVLTDALGSAFNGTTWDRIRSVATNADAVAGLALGAVAEAAFGFLYNGTTWDRARSYAAGLVSKTATLTGFPVQLPFAKYTATRPTLADGEAAPFEANTRGDLCVQEQYAPVAEDNTNGVEWNAAKPLSGSTNALSWSDTLVAASGVVKNSPGRAYVMIVSNGNAATRFIQLHDATSLPGNGATPKFSFRVPATTAQTFDLARYGRYFATGIVVASSTTEGTLTIGSADMTAHVGYA